MTTSAGKGPEAEGPRLRPMTDADLSGVVDLDHAVFAEEAWSRRMLLGELEQQPESRYYLVAEQEGALIGYAGLLVVREQADVLTIAVAAAWWGRGVGTRLLAALLAEARRRGCTEVFLEVRADNARAQRLYKWWGFYEIGIRRGYYQPSGMDAIVMRRDLAVESEAEQVAPGVASGGAR
jgi:[ribosomal protein S18]-alanine N-acetyltransferase